MAQQPFSEKQAELLREQETQIHKFLSRSEGHFVCAGVGVTSDKFGFGPIYYFDERSRKPISLCNIGWPNRTDKDALCLKWEAENCWERKREFDLAKLPDITYATAWGFAISFTGCNSPGVHCHMTGEFANGEWVFDITYLSFDDRSAQEWVQRFGMSRLVIGMKGQVIRYEQNHVGRYP